MWKVFSFLFGLTLLHLGCENPNEECCDGPKEVMLGKPFSINEGETVEVGNSIVELTFSQLINDSLCPSDVACFTEGYMTIAVDINGTERTLSIGNSSRPKTIYKDYTIELQRLLHPNKTAEKASSNSTYSVQMEIIRSQ